MALKLEKLSRRAGPVPVACCALAVLVALHAWRAVLEQSALRARAAAAAAAPVLDETAEALAELEAARGRRLKQLNAFKRGLPKLAEDRRQVYEEGLALQEEKRLLEKQLEIMTTYLVVDEAAGEVRLMRGEQALQTFPLASGAPRSYGAAPAARPLDAVVSKERFAHPERPKAEQINGQLQWEPPQVGTSARANALGEYVVFTRGPLILHGPPRKRAEHDAYTHVCLELSPAVARKLYALTYIGTKIVVKPADAAVAAKGKKR